MPSILDVFKYLNLFFSKFAKFNIRIVVYRIEIFYYTVFTNSARESRDIVKLYICKLNL